MDDVPRHEGNDRSAGRSAESQPRVAVIIGGQPGQIGECRVDDPGRLLRAWSLLNASDQELHQVSLPPGATSRLGRQLHAVAAELDRSLPIALTAELQRVLKLGESQPLTPAELRVEYAGVLGWTGGLIVAMLAQLENAGAPRDADLGLQAPLAE